MFDAADKSLIGRRVQWQTWGQTHTGIIENVILEAKLCYRPGDWVVKVDSSPHYATVIGAEAKLIK